MRKNEGLHSASVRRDDEQTVPLAIAQSLPTLAYRRLGRALSNGQLPVYEHGWRSLARNSVRLGAQDLLVPATRTAPAKSRHRPHDIFLLDCIMVMTALLEVKAITLRGRTPAFSGFRCDIFWSLSFSNVDPARSVCPPW